MNFDFSYDNPTIKNKNENVKKSLAYCHFLSNHPFSKETFIKKSLMPRPFDCITNFLFIENEPEKADIILIPGGLRPQLMNRAVELYQQGYAPYILPSGGAGPKLAKEIKEGTAHWKSEWEFLQNIATQKGVPETAILKEDQALNTYENAKFSLQTVQQQNLKINKAILICKAYHARRALLTYQASFSSDIEYIICPIIDDRDIRKDNWFLDETKIEIVMGEVEKIGKYFAKRITHLRDKRLVSEE